MVLVALVFVAGLAWTPTLQAQAVSPATDNEEEARALFIAGRSAFDQGRFEEALSHFKRSYELSGRPELLYNIGTAADRVGRLEEAITAFRSYLEGSPDSPRRPQIRGSVGGVGSAARQPTRARTASGRRALARGCRTRRDGQARGTGRRGPLRYRREWTIEGPHDRSGERERRRRRRRRRPERRAHRPRVAAQLHGAW
ncbi:MAG: tetratricopeptide repeat protein [Sandaracinaceae bacterium]|nr:tetratricopeptide repeat protein [Sandaracinaceae bacterium]